MTSNLVAKAFAFAACVTASSASADYDGPWKLFDPNNVYFSDLFRDNSASNSKYLAFKSTNGAIWVFIDAAWDYASPGTGPYTGYWVSYQNNPGFECSGPPAVDDLGLNHNVWGYINAFAAPDGKNIQFDATHCYGQWFNWAQTLE